RVAWIDGHCGIAQNGFGARGGDGNILLLRLARNWLDRIAHVIELGRSLFDLDLQIGDGTHAARAPVDDPLAAIDQPLFVTPDKDLADRVRQPFIQGEAFAGPVAGRAEPPMLVLDAVLVLPDPLPDPLDKRLAPKLVAVRSLFGKLPFDNGLGGDARVIF